MTGEQEIEARQPGGEQVGKLVAKKAVGPAIPHIARMNVVQEIQRDEVVLPLPEEVRQEYRDGQGDAHPEPFVCEVAAQIGQNESRDNANHQKGHGVLRERAKSDGGAGGKPPPRVAGPDQAHDAKRREDPGEVIEGDVLHQGPAADRERRRQAAGQELGVAPAAEIARHQAGQDDCDSVRQ
ncbi:MAG TPA: hypothetical protein VMB03_18875 [Bryobacteraceae bacterium]|nr:hypothetical protein [Bryobacteraceae bacterium]